MLAVSNQHRKPFKPNIPHPYKNQNKHPLKNLISYLLHYIAWICIGESLRSQFSGPFKLPNCLFVSNRHSSVNLNACFPEQCRYRTSPQIQSAFTPQPYKLSDEAKPLALRARFHLQSLTCSIEADHYTCFISLPNGTVAWMHRWTKALQRWRRVGSNPSEISAWCQSGKRHPVGAYR